MAILEGNTGIVSAGKKAQSLANKRKNQKVANLSDSQERKELRSLLSLPFLTEKQKNDIINRTSGTKPLSDASGVNTEEKRPNYFSPGGGAFDKRNDIKVASSDLSNLKTSGFTDDEEGSDASTFGKSFTKQASANLADSSIYKKKEDNVYKDTTDAYSDFKNIYKSPATEEDTVKSIEKFYGLDPRGIKYVPRDESKYGETPTKGAFPGQEDKVITTKEKITGVRDFGYMKGDKLYGTFNKQQGGLGIGVQLDQNKYGLVPRLGGLGGMFSDDKVTQTYVKAIAQQKADVLSAEERNRQNRLRNPQNYNDDGSFKTLDQKYGGFLNERDKMEAKYAKDLGYDSYADYQKSREEFNNRINNKFSEKSTSIESEKKDPTTLQKVGNFIGNITNAALGIQPARGGELTNERTGIDKALSGATKKFHLGSSGHSVDGVYMPSIAETYKRPKTGIEKGFEQLGNFIGKLTRPPGAQGAEMPSATKNETGDTSFSAYVRGGGEGQERGKATDTSKKTVAGLPSNYKATEAEAFRKAAAFKEAQGIAKRNPNVSVGVDSKGQPKATATNDSGRARAQAAAVNRKLAGKSISQVRAANNQAMRDRAAARHAAFKKTGKSTVSARRAAAKAKVKAAARKRHSAFKKKRKARKKSKKGKK